jgi:hypothetical protein
VRAACSGRARMAVLRKAKTLEYGSMSDMDKLKEAIALGDVDQARKLLDAHRGLVMNATRWARRLFISRRLRGSAKSLNC